MSEWVWGVLALAASITLLWWVRGHGCHVKFIFTSYIFLYPQVDLNYWKCFSLSWKTQWTCIPSVFHHVFPQLKVADKDEICVFLQESAPSHLHLHPSGDAGLHHDQHRLLLLHDATGVAGLQRCGRGEQIFGSLKLIFQEGLAFDVIQQLHGNTLWCNLKVKRAWDRPQPAN